MTHLSENCIPLAIRQPVVQDWSYLTENMNFFNGVCAVLFPFRKNRDRGNICCLPKEILTGLAENLGPDATLICIGEPADLVHAHTALSVLHYQLWISIKRETPNCAKDNTSLPEYHFGALVHKKYKGSLKHSLTRIQYSHCPACGKTTKDYGGKKHTCNSYGTLISDVWRDIACDLDSDLTPILERFAELFGLEPYRELRVLDCRFIMEDTENLILGIPFPAYPVQKGFTDKTNQHRCSFKPGCLPIWKCRDRSEPVPAGKILPSEYPGGENLCQRNPYCLSFLFCFFRFCFRFWPHAAPCI